MRLVIEAGTQGENRWVKREGSSNYCLTSELSEATVFDTVAEADMVCDRLPASLSPCVVELTRRDEVPENVDGAAGRGQRGEGGRPVAGPADVVRRLCRKDRFLVGKVDL